MKNNDSKGSKRLNSLYELNEAIKKLTELEKAEPDILASIVDKEAKVEKREEIQKTKQGFINLISAGLEIEDVSFIDGVIEDISFFLSKYGYSKEEIDKQLLEISFYTSDMELLSGGKLSTSGNKIGIDYSYCEFDSEGKAKGLVEGKEAFFRYVITHELFHVLSLKNTPYNMNDDAFSEGITDMLAHIVSGNYDDKSDLYDFPVKVCMMFTEMLGMDKVLDDYLHDINGLSNITNLFMECGVDDFSSFRSMFSSVIEISKLDRKQGKVSNELALEQKISCLDFLQSNIIIPYCMKNIDQASQVLSTFNNLFKDFGVNCNLDDIKMNEDGMGIK